MAADKSNGRADAAARFARHAKRLSLSTHKQGDGGVQQTTAVKAHFITSQDPVIETASGDRLPAVPLTEARKLNKLKEQVLGHDEEEEDASNGAAQQEDARENEQLASTVQSAENNEERSTTENAGAATEQPRAEEPESEQTSGTLKTSHPPSQTNPLFPPLPLYGPPNILRDMQCLLLRFTSFWLSLAFLGVIIVGAAFTSLPLMFMHIWLRLTCRVPDARRPFYEEEQRRRKARKQEEDEWKRRERRRSGQRNDGEKDVEGEAGHNEEFVPTEGGRDRLVCDPAYYARRVGLDLEEFDVQTEDGFIISLWHVYNPREYNKAAATERAARGPDVFSESAATDPAASPSARRRRTGAPVRYPVLLMHGLLQSAGAYCTNDDSSLAFFLAKSGYDVWLGNNRCGFAPRHTLLKYGDPRMWAFNIRQMGVLDLPALMSRVLGETGFARLGLVCHSQGTTQTLVALARDQRPDLGSRISVFCALAPAAYAGPLIDKAYFKFMKAISPLAFRVVFGIHAFIPFMMTMHSTLPGLLYGAVGYRVFSFLFDWTDDRWERALRDRLFQFAPVYVSAESMRWWLGRDGFAKHRCILATRDELRREAEEDRAQGPAPGGSGSAGEQSGRSEQSGVSKQSGPEAQHGGSQAQQDGSGAQDSSVTTGHSAASPSSIDATPNNAPSSSRAWFDERAPKMAFWVAGADRLVDGRRLLRRFERGREPHARVVHTRVIPGYEHLDVLWAVDVLDTVGYELRDVLWRAAEAGPGVAVPKGCEQLGKSERAGGQDEVVGEKGLAEQTHVGETKAADQENPAVGDTATNEEEATCEEHPADREDASNRADLVHGHNVPNGEAPPDRQSIPDEEAPAGQARAESDA